MRRIMIVAALGATLAATLAGCGATAPAVDTARIAADVKADVKAVIAAYDAHDAAGAAKHDAPDFVGMFHGAPNVAGPAGDAAAMRAQMADPAARFETGDERVDVAASGDLAVYRSTYDYAYTDPATKKILHEKGNWIAGYRRQPDGTMKLAWDIGADLPAGAKP